MDKIATTLEKTFVFLEKHGRSVLYLLLVAIMAVGLAHLLVSSCQHNNEVHVLVTEQPIDSVRTAASKEEQTIEAMWDSLKVIQP